MAKERPKRVLRGGITGPGGVDLTPAWYRQMQEEAMEGDEFWADALLDLKRAGKNEEVVEMCGRHLPAPAAFREMAIALRKLIREARKADKDDIDLLDQLYDIAAYHAFLYRMPAVEVDGRSLPSTTISFDAHRAGIWSQLHLGYQSTGYQHLGLLNKTDVKWLVEALGEPERHAEPQLDNPEIWEQALMHIEQ